MAKPLQYIAIEGPIGVGKTTLARLLAEEFKFKLNLEDVHGNPFLADFYKDRNKYGFQTQVFFLLSRYQQQKELVQNDLFQQGFLADYIFAKDRIFAMLNLSDEELTLYESLYNLLDARNLENPISSSFCRPPPRCFETVSKKRKIPYEKHRRGLSGRIGLGTYNRFFFSYTETPLLVVNCSEIDFVEKPEDYRNLLKEIVQMRKQKLQKHYVSISSK
jgi:deoxyadenosine/deoxycytidine kinase